MPLLRKKVFEKASVPELLRDDEEVFHCQVTNEIFRDYDEFCQRIILVNSMVWSCSMTGKTNLTYAEALQSEEAAKKSLNDFPIELRIPVLFLASKTKRTAFSDMSDDVFAFVKDRYFVGEIVESSFTENNWRESHVLQVIAPTDEQVKACPQTNGKSPERCFNPPASLFRYEVEQLDANDQDSSQVMMLEANHVRRKKGPYTKEKNRLFLKQFVEFNNQGIIVIKESVKDKYKLDTIRFDRIFDGPLPDFEQSKKIVNGKKVRQETLVKYFEKTNAGSNGAKSLLVEMKRKEEEYKQKVIEMKQKREEEKKKQKEENLKLSTYVKEWYKPRDDLELEDQKELPVGVSVQSKIPSKYFGDALMILEFINSFSTLLSSKDFFSGGLTFDLLERALTEKEVAGPLTDLIQMLLTTMFNIQDEEAAEHKESQSQTELNSDDIFDSMSLSEATHLATLAFNWSIVYQGMPLSRLPLYPLTISEVLRLHLLSSGARLNEAATKWRYQQRGGYMSEDDPGLTLRLKQPHILKALAIHNVNQLPLSDRIAIITCLVNQLLTYADVRDAVEERIEKTRQLKADLKTLQIAEKRREQEFVSAKLKIKREHKGQEALIKEELDKLEREAETKRGEFEKQNRMLVKSLSVLQNVLGTDRAFQRYVKIDSIPALFIENDERNPGRCLDRITPQNPELIDADRANTLTYVKKLYESCNGSDKENENGIKKSSKKPNGLKSSQKLDSDVKAACDLKMCTANNKSCPVHSSHNKPAWTFYHNKDDIQDLISSLNKRGLHELELKQVVESEREHLENLVMETNVLKLNPTVATNSTPVDKPVNKKLQSMYSRYEDSNLGFPADANVSEVLRVSLVDNILEMEEKLFSGSLGQLKIKDRNVWRNNVTYGHYAEIEKGSVLRRDENPKIEKLKVEGRNSRPGTPDSLYKDPGRYLGSTVDVDFEDSDSENDKKLLTPTNDHQQAVHALSIALLQVGQAVDPRYLKKPLGHADVKSKQKDESDVLEKWEQSLLASTSYGQVFLHYCNLENCIMWGRSVLLTRCRICHRLKDPQNMLLCDNCNKGHHIYCLKPKLTSIPKGDWFCDKCKPKEKPPTPRSSRRARKIFTEISEEEEDEVEEEEEEGEDEEEYEPEIELQSESDVTMIEVCDVCGKGGHVICCDFCPKVYHLECTQPVLRRVPRGEWKCHRCKRKNDRSKESDSVSSEEVPAQRRSTRRTLESKGVDNDDGLPLHNAALQELLADVMKHPDAWPFTRPVTKHEVPDYYDVITKPMDFGKIKYKLNMGEYRCDADVMEDAALVFENCDTYNNSEADVYKCGVRLLKYFEKRAREAGLKFPEGLMGTGTDEEETYPTESKRPRYQ